MAFHLYLSLATPLPVEPGVALESAMPELKPSDYHARGRAMTHHASPIERMMMFHRGFADGARTSAHKHPDDEDYMQGWKKGNRRASIARIQYANRIGFNGDVDDVSR